MPKLRKLSGKEIVSILCSLGFEVTRIKGNHYRLKIQNAQGDYGLTIPVSGNNALPIAVIYSIYEDASDYIDEQILRGYFYTDQSIT